VLSQEVEFEISDDDDDDLPPELVKAGFTMDKLAQMSPEELRVEMQRLGIDWSDSEMEDGNSDSDGNLVIEQSDAEGSDSDGDKDELDDPETVEKVLNNMQTELEKARQGMNTASVKEALWRDKPQ
jgi:hypothetical protein